MTIVILSNEVEIAAEVEFEQWCQRHRDKARNLPIQGRLYAALVILWHLETGEWEYGELAQVSSVGDPRYFGDRAIRNHTKARVVSILRMHGQIDLIPSVEAGGESGRTSGSTKRAGLEFMRLIGEALTRAPAGHHNRQEGDALVAYLYGRIFALLAEHRNLQGITAPYVASESMATYIAKLLNAHQTNPGAVLQHLIGAKLDLRFAEQPGVVGHHSAATADVQIGRLGDFEIGSTVFHVTKNPTNDHFRKAWQNAQNGRKVYLLVPRQMLTATISLAEVFKEGFTKKIDIHSVEGFVTQNLDELAVFDRDEALRQLHQVLTKYNELVARYENDPSLKIVIPDFGVNERS